MVVIQKCLLTFHYRQFEELKIESVTSLRYYNIIIRTINLKININYSAKQIHFFTKHILSTLYCYKTCQVFRDVISLSKYEKKRLCIDCIGFMLSQLTINPLLFAILIYNVYYNEFFVTHKLKHTSSLFHTNILLRLIFCYIINMWRHS